LKEIVTGFDMRDLKNLKIWEKSRKLTSDLYEINSCFPEEKYYEISNHINRSAAELEYLMIFSSDLGYIKEELSAHF
jgi:hypothetical protein